MTGRLRVQVSCTEMNEQKVYQVEAIGGKLSVPMSASHSLQALAETLLAGAKRSDMVYVLQNEYRDETYIRPEGTVHTIRKLTDTECTELNTFLVEATKKAKAVAAAP